MIRVFNHYLSLRVIALTLVDAIVLFQALLLGHQLRLATAADSPPYFEATLFTLVLLLSMSAVGMYQVGLISWRTTIRRLLAAYAVALILMSVIFYMFQEIYVGRGVLLYAVMIGLAGVVIVRLASFRLSDIDGWKHRILLVGTALEIAEFRNELNSNSRLRNSKLCGVFEVGRDGANTSGARQRSMMAQILENDISEVVVAVKDQRGGTLPVKDLLECKLAGIKVVDLVSFHERESGFLPLDSLRTSWLISGAGFVVGGWRDVFKRVFDIAISTLIMVLTMPVMLLTMLAIWLEDRSPVIYRQQRIGEGGREFTILKFRSMKHKKDQPSVAQWAQTNDSRITRVGKFIRETRIDELPQLLNVLRGDMSFVGPRPEQPPIVAELVDSVPFYHVRHSVKPGITGWAQVRYKYGQSHEDARMKQQYDLYYVKNHSLLLDLIILIETIEVVVLRKGSI